MVCACCLDYTELIQFMSTNISADELQQLVENLQCSLGVCLYGLTNSVYNRIHLQRPLMDCILRSLFHLNGHNFGKAVSVIKNDFQLFALKLIKEYGKWNRQKNSNLHPKIGSRECRFGNKELAVNQLGKQDNDETKFCLQPVPLASAFEFPHKFPKRNFNLMMAKLAITMAKPNKNEFFHVTKSLKEKFAIFLDSTDMVATVMLMESMLAYNTGDVHQSLLLASEAKHLTSRAVNKGVLIAEANTQLAVTYRRDKMFGLAEDLLSETLQILHTVELCHSHASVLSHQAKVYTSIMECTPRPCPTYRKRAISCVIQAIDIMHRIHILHGSKEHHLMDLYLHLAEVYLDVLNSDMTNMRTVTADDISNAHLCIEKAKELVRFDSYGRGLIRLQRCQSKLAIREIDYLKADTILREATDRAKKLNLGIDLQLCTDMQRVLRNSKEYQKQKLMAAVIHKSKDSNVVSNFENTGFNEFNDLGKRPKTALESSHSDDVSEEDNNLCAY